ncbi:ComEA family DNA-binding protein [Actinoallomurus purpureus]|uniref:ComEA family DNA-binding protein n=1 Tax=Actinoallomurus purpureus TaxID=478114 RepID=UPI0020923AA1|nr:ComEA family DNA-binding protein [Actinoallomurus purpureus]MCO6006353.1 ComEA family DNA-binding protein [Actinoallomurus purpureus]
MPSFDAAPFDRLRDVFRPPQSFGPDDDAGSEPPGAALRVSPQAPGRRIRIDPGTPGIRVLAAVGLLAVLVSGAYLWWSRPEPRPVTPAIVSPAAHRAAPMDVSAPRPAMPVTPATSSSPVLVDVAGKVRHPGVVSLPAGARVIDAIKAAGGVRPGAGTGTLNLARRVVDGEQILVGVDATPAAALPPGAPPGAATPTGAPLDLNTAGAAQLDQLPGVGPVLAQRIVDYRTQHGGFRSVDELRQVSGIGAAKFGDLKGLVTV